MLFNVQHSLEMALMKVIQESDGTVKAHFESPSHRDDLIVCVFPQGLAVPLHQSPSGH